MTRNDFRASLSEIFPPLGLTGALMALWWQRKGDWDKAHGAAQSDNGAEAAWVHALLHRQEGDLSNAAYWYRRADREVRTDTLEAEWEAIVTELLPEGR